jgi:hypothetical protein
MNEHTPQPTGRNDRELVLVYADSWGLREEFSVLLQLPSDVATNAHFRHERYTEMASARGFVRPHTDLPP